MTDNQPDDDNRAIIEQMAEAQDDSVLNALSDEVDEMREDETTDFDAQSRQDEGWLKFYVECPDCEVPMARTTVESEDEGMVGDVRRSTTEIRAVCPDCGAIGTTLQITRTTGPFGTLHQ